jgi:hypothetical protein
VGTSTLTLIVSGTEISKDLVDTTTVNVVKKDGKKFINQYEIVKDLGKGSFGKVRLPLCSVRAVSKKIKQPRAT